MADNVHDSSCTLSATTPFSPLIISSLHLLMVSSIEEMERESDRKDICDGHRYRDSSNGMMDICETSYFFRDFRI